MEANHESLMQAGRDEVDRVLTITRAARCPGGAKPLYHLLDMPSGVGSYHGYPAICGGSGRPESLTFLDAQRIKARIESTCTWDGFDFKKWGVVVAGGAISSVSSNGRSSPNDIDLFLIGDTPVRSIRAIIKHARSQVKSIRLVRTPDTLTIYGNDYNNYPPLQIVLRRYASLADVLYSFDLGSSAVGWDGVDVWYSEAGRFTRTWGMNILDLEARNASYEHRLAKYMRRGFGVVMPGLDPMALGMGPLRLAGDRLTCEPVSSAPSCGCARQVSIRSKAISFTQYDEPEIVGSNVTETLITLRQEVLRAADPSRSFRVSQMLEVEDALDLDRGITSEDLKEVVHSATIWEWEVNIPRLRLVFPDPADAAKVLFGGGIKTPGLREMLERRAKEFTFPPLTIPEVTGHVFEAFPREPLTEVEWYGPHLAQ